MARNHGHSHSTIIWLTHAISFAIRPLGIIPELIQPLSKLFEISIFPIWRHDLSEDRRTELRHIKMVKIFENSTEFMPEWANKNIEEDVEAAFDKYEEQKRRS